jgi:hypothetical protein
MLSSTWAGGVAQPAMSAAAENGIADNLIGFMTDFLWFFQKPGGILAQ